jgi:hypothetical protein
MLKDDIEKIIIKKGNKKQLELTFQTYDLSHKNKTTS